MVCLECLEEAAGVTWLRNEYVNDVPIKGGQTYVHIYMDGTGEIVQGE